MIYSFKAGTPWLILASGLQLQNIVKNLLNLRQKLVYLPEAQVQHTRTHMREESICPSMIQKNTLADPRRLRRNFFPATHKMRDFSTPRRPNASKQVLARLAWSGGRAEGGLEGVWALHQDERKFCRFDFSEFLLKTAEIDRFLC